MKSLPFSAAGVADDKPWFVRPARYAKGQVLFKHDGRCGMKSRGDRLAEALRGRYTHRERAYVLSPTKAQRVLSLLQSGWDASYFTDELIPPEQHDDNK